MSEPIRCKFVIVEAASLGGLTIPVLLPACLEHSAAAAIGIPRAAGYVEVDELGRLHATGESVSLKLKSHPDNDRLLNLWFSGLTRPQPGPVPAP